MKHSLGQALSEYGFRFYEKLREPIFLVHRFGQITKVNEAGRKLLKISHWGVPEIEAHLLNGFQEALRFHKGKCFYLRPPHLHLKLLVRDLKESDYVLVEVIR